MTTPALTELLDLALQSERLGRFADARDWLRRASPWTGAQRHSMPGCGSGGC